MTYLYTDARVTRFIEGRSIGESLSVGDPIEYQTPLIQGGHGVTKEVVQQNLGFVGNEVNVKKRETDVVEFETLALV